MAEPNFNAAWEGDVSPLIVTSPSLGRVLERMVYCAALHLVEVETKAPDRSEASKAVLDKYPVHIHMRVEFEEPLER